MGDTFTVAVTATIEKSGVEVSYIGSSEAEEGLRDSFYSLSDSITFEDAEVIETNVTVRARVRIDDIEVEVSDFADFDAENAAHDALGYDVSRVSDAEFEVEDGPTGWDTLEPLLGQEQAIEVLVALQRDGLSII
jgi:hypothetical protein